MSFRPKKKPEPLDEPALYEYAVKALGRRMRTVSELERLLRPRAQEGESGIASIRAVILRLQEQRYLDDPAYAATFTRLRQENQRFGKRRVQQELTRKGVAAETITTTVTAAYAEVSEEELARQHLERRRIARPSGDKEIARVVRRLVAAGFSTPTVFKVLKAWQASDETLAALETLDENENNGSE